MRTRQQRKRRKDVQSVRAAEGNKRTRSVPLRCDWLLALCWLGSACLLPTEQHADNTNTQRVSAMEASQRYARRTEISGRDRKRTNNSRSSSGKATQLSSLSRRHRQRCSGATALTTARVQNAASSSTSRQAVRAGSASKQYERVSERCGNRQPSPQQTRAASKAVPGSCLLGESETFFSIGDLLMTFVIMARGARRP